MSDTPGSPFARLDTNLLRSTREREPASIAQEPTPFPAALPAASARAATTPRVRETKKPRKTEPTIPRNRDTVIPRHHDTTVSSQEEGSGDHADVVARIRRAVRVVGKESATLRLTVEEKRRLAEVIYGYKQVGTKTSETEIIRIALNYMLDDFGHRGERSILSQVLDALAS